MIQPSDTPSLPGSTVADSDGTPVGVLANTYTEPGTGNPLWASVRRSVSGGPDVFVPLENATLTPGGPAALQLSVPTAALDGAPFIDPAATFTDTQAHTLSAYYDQARPRPDEGRSSSSRRVDSSAWVVRSEQRLLVHTETHPTERVRFRKVIVEEEKTFTVTLRREEFQLIREPLEPKATFTASNNDVGHGMGIDLILHEERLVVSTEVVPVERIRVDVIRVTDTVPVTANLQQERIDVSTPDGISH